MTAVAFGSGAIVGVGEAMVEFAPVEGGLYAQGFAGDTLNTCWYLARLAPEGTFGPLSDARRQGCAV